MVFVLQSVYVTDWFFDQQLSLAMGVINSVPSMFCFISGIMSGTIYENAGGLEGGGIEKVFLLGAFINLVCLIMVIMLVIMHNKAQKLDMITL